MAQLVFSEVGARVGAALLPEGFQLLGETISGAAIGQAVGAVAGAGLQHALSGPVSEGRRLDGLSVMESREGAGIASVYGRTRIAGQVIWATHLREIKTDKKVGGKTGPKVSEYSYTISFAVALCEGEITSLDRIWANGEAVSLAGLNTRLYRGTETQGPDPLIEAVEGSAPAYRGLAYLVLEDFPLDAYGARLPQLAFEVTRPVPPANGPMLGDVVRGVNFIPASGEWVYSPELVRRIEYPGWEETLNRNSATGEVDVLRSLDQMQAELPNVSTLNLTLAWFGTDLRCGMCEIRPGVETPDQINLPDDWSAGGLTRETAHLISRDEEGRPYYGGTPDDASVLALLDELNSRGVSVTVSPFVLMDVPPENDLSDPYGGEGQAPFPWRGRISCDPAIGVVGTSDGTAQAREQVEAFFGEASASDFTLEEGVVSYSGPSDWGYRRFVLHLAMLAKQAGTVDRFLLGSELIGLTRIRDDAGAFPAVDEMRELLAEVRSVLGASVELGYAADWTEYGAYVPQDGSGDVLFPLDPLWADTHLDFVGIDWYAPLSDWRDGEHLDGGNWPSIYDPDYLKANVAGGEGFDWYYASAADQTDQIRTPVSDTAYNEDWIFRVKDLRGWWQSSHYPRESGVRSATPTAWTAQSKPVRLIEIGCGAVDKGTNAPNVFYDPKSSESGLPPFSSGVRDDAIQAAAIKAIYDYWLETPGTNPISPHYAGPMIPEDGISVWAYDARPFPAFPMRQDVWSDGANWERGHWLNGRLSQSDLAGLVKEACGKVGVAADVSGVRGRLHGVSTNGLTTLQEFLSPIASAFGLRCVQEETGLSFANELGSSLHMISDDDLAFSGNRLSARSDTRQMMDHSPRGLRVTVMDPDADYQPISVHRGETPDGDRDLHVRLPFALPSSDLEALADYLYSVTISAKWETQLSLSPERLDVCEGDLVMLAGELEPSRVIGCTLGGASTLTLGRALEGFDGQSTLAGAGKPPAHVPRPDVVVLDLPSLPGREDDIRPLVAASASPWPGYLTVQAGGSETSLSTRASLSERAMIGRLLTAFPAGPGDRIRHTLSLFAEFPDADLVSVSHTDFLAGDNLIAVETGLGWMIVAYQRAELVSDKLWKLSGLLTGMGGTEDLSAISAEEGARLVVLNRALSPAELSDHELGQKLVWRAVGPGAEADPLTFQSTVEGRALKPFRPGHLRALRQTNGDLDVSWTRRPRHSADRLAPPDVPRLEDELKFRVSILSDGALIRTEEVEDVRWTYDFASQMADAIPASGFTIKVAQMSSRVGDGVPAQLSV